jgi:hypothetical protein
VLNGRALGRLLAAFASAALAGAPGPGLAQGSGGGPGFGTPDVDVAFMLGRWTGSGNCAEAVDFEADGTFATPEGIAGRWSMEGDRITLDEDDATTTVRVLAVDEDTIELRTEDGSSRRSTRCQSDDDEDAPALRVA